MPMSPDDYIQRLREIDGWLSPSDARVLLRIAESIEAKGRPVCEIGVHHGKLALFLGLLTGGRCVGYDLFARQEENVDRSGHGDQDAFLANAARVLGTADGVRAIEANSLDLTPERILEDCGGAPVIFSVDGGHTAELTANDLVLAAATVAHDGIVVLDDVYNQAWPEVAFGAVAALSDGRAPLIPFCVLQNKLLLAKTAAAAEAYRGVVDRLDSQTHPGLLHLASNRLLGHPVTTVVVARDGWDWRRQLGDTPLWRSVRQTAAGRMVRRIAGRG